MLLCNETKDKFGYTVDSLSSGSSKPIIVSCDYCEIVYETTIKRRIIAHKSIKKDACPKCKYIKMGEMNIIKYGVENVFQLDSIKEKIVSTNIEKYGVSAPQLNHDIREKSKKTCIEKYGCENPSQSSEIRAKIEKTNITRYGGTSPTSSEEIKAKVRSTNLERFGNEHYLASDDCRNRVKDKYGVDNVFQLDSVKAKIIDSRIASGNIKLYQGKTVSDWAESFGFSRSHFNDMVNLHGWEFAITCTKQYTNIENVIRNILESNNIDYIFDRSIGKYRPDFLMGNIIIEVDGLWYHSDAVNCNKNYHAEKRHFYTTNGYTPMFFRQDEVLDKTKIVESVILNKIGKSNKIYARKTVPKEISKVDGSFFLKENHLMGSGAGRCFALFYNNEIVACLRMKRISDGWEISRFATKLGINVVGGFTKLISLFTSIVGNTNITTFIDLRYGSGSYLPSIGFDYIGSNLSFKWTDGHQTFHRMKFKGNSGYDNGLFKIWDCGQAKFVLIDRGAL